jgi:TM2 domain-containing membrane protein YozV
MTQPYPDANSVPPEGYDRPAAPPYQEAQNPTGPQPQQPYQQPYAGPQQGYPAGQQQPYGGPQQPYQPYGGPQQQYQQPQQQGYPAGPQQPYQQPQYQGNQPSSLQPQYHQHPPMPNPAYGYPQAKSKIVAGLLGLFLGGLGIHRFYLGFTKVAVIQLVLTLVVSIFTVGLGLFFVGLWGFIEGIMILAGATNFQRDAHGVPLRD